MESAVGRFVAALKTEGRYRDKGRLTYLEDQLSDVREEIQVGLFVDFVLRQVLPVALTTAGWVDEAAEVKEYRCSYKPEEWKRPIYVVKFLSGLHERLRLRSKEFSVRWSETLIENEPYNNQTLALDAVYAGLLAAFAEHRSNYYGGHDLDRDHERELVGHHSALAVVAARAWGEAFCFLESLLPSDVTVVAGSSATEGTL